MSTTTFNRGIPTEPDVRRLEERFGAVASGVFLTWELLEQALNIKRQDSRFRTVLKAWRKKLFRDHNILLGPVPSKGLKVLDGHERAGFSGSKYKAGLRRIGYAGTVAERTDTADLSPEDRRTVDHVRASASALRLIAATRAKELPPIK